MAEAGIPAPRRLILSEEASAQSRQWTEWSKELIIYFEAAGITAGKRKRALLLYLGGEVLRDIYESYEDTEKTFESTFTVVNGHFEQKINLSYERFKFHSATTNSSEGFLSYLTRLKKLARSCNFDNYSTEDAIVYHYIRTCGSDTVKRKLLSNENLDLATMTAKVSSIELVDSQVKVMDHKPNCYEEVHEISNRGTGKRVFICYGCGEPGHAIHSTDCPARDIICSKCGTKGHYVRQCLRKGRNSGSQVHELSVKEEAEGLRDLEKKLFSMKVKDDDYLF